MQYAMTFEYRGPHVSSIHGSAAFAKHSGAAAITTFGPLSVMLAMNTSMPKGKNSPMKSSSTALTAHVTSTPIQLAIMAASAWNADG